MSGFTAEEYADMIFLYGFCDGNANATRLEYLRRYPQRKLPNERTITNCYRRLRETGRTTSSLIDRGVTGRRAANIEQQIVSILRNDPSLSTRELAMRLNCSKTQVLTILKKKLFTSLPLYTSARAPTTGFRTEDYFF